MIIRPRQLAVLCCLLLASPAESDEHPESRPGPLANLTVEGGTTFDSAQIRSALHGDLDIQWELERKAPLVELVEVLRKKTGAGYRHAGFPDVRIETSTKADVFAEAIVVNVHEGRRFRAGEVRIENAVQIPVAEVREALTSPFPPHDATPRFYEGGDGQAVKWVDADEEEVDCEEATWKTNEWASFADESMEWFEQRVRNVLTDCGFPTAEFHVRLERHQPRGTADLVISIDDEGRHAEIDRIELIGNEYNSRDVILSYLQVQPSLVFTRDERIRIERRLWHSGRFAECEVELIQPLPEFNTRLSPALFMLAAHRLNWAWEDDGQLVTRRDRGVLKIDPRTGQLSAESEASSLSPWRIDFQRGAFARRNAEIAQAARDATNEYDARRVASSIVQFLDSLGTRDADRSVTETAKTLVADFDLATSSPAG